MDIVVKMYEERIHDDLKIKIIEIQIQASIKYLMHYLHLIICIWFGI